MLKRLGRVIYWAGCAIGLAICGTRLIYLTMLWVNGGPDWGEAALVSGVYVAILSGISYAIGRAALYILADE